METHFPSLDHEEKVKRQRDNADETAGGKKARQRVQGRTLAQVTAKEVAQQTDNW